MTEATKQNTPKLLPPWRAWDWTDGPCIQSDQGLVAQFDRDGQVLHAYHDERTLLPGETAFTPAQALAIVQADVDGYFARHFEDALDQWAQEMDEDRDYDLGGC